MREIAEVCVCAGSGADFGRVCAYGKFGRLDLVYIDFGKEARVRGRGRNCTYVRCCGMGYAGNGFASPDCPFFAGSAHRKRSCSASGGLGVTAPGILYSGSALFVTFRSKGFAVTGLRRASRRAVPET